MRLRKSHCPALLMIGAVELLALTLGCGGGGDGDGAAGSGGESGDGSGGTHLSGGSKATGGKNEESGGTTDANGGSTNESGGTANSSGGTEASGGTVDGSGGSVAQAGQDPGTTTPAPEFEGVDLENLSLPSTPGCQAGLDLDKHSLTLTVEAESHTLLIDAFEGKFRANSRICTARDGTLALVSELEHLSIRGTSEADSVTLDLLTAPLGDSLLASAGAISIDLGEGSDRLSIRGTREDDHWVCAGDNVETTSHLDLGTRVKAVDLLNAESLLASLGPGNDSFSGGDDPLHCGVALVVYGGDGGDLFQGGSQNDLLNGGTGNDEFDMGRFPDGLDVVNGGPDDDLVSYARRTSDLVVHLCNTPAITGCSAPECTCSELSGEPDERDLIVNVEDADGGHGNDRLVGDEDANVLSGREGNDLLESLGGTDQVYGDDGDDTINGGDDGDILMGGTGKNSIDGAAGDDICFVSSHDSPPSGCETKIDLP